MSDTLTSPDTRRRATKEKQLEVLPLEEFNNYIKKLIEGNTLKIKSFSIIADNNQQPLVFVKVKEDGSLVVIETKGIKEKAPAKAKTKVGLKKLVPTFEEETKEQYEGAMELSKITNRNIARKLAKAKNLDLPFRNAIEILKRSEKQRKELTIEELQIEIAFTQKLLFHLLKIEMLLQEIDEDEFKPVTLHFIKALKRYQLSLEDELENKVFFYNARINQSRIIAKYLD
jgi:hypothetical protein|nr:hypothetical protein [uncultured Capnocytophaga sp.]